MRKPVCEKDRGSNKKLPWLPQFDRMLIAGIKHGPAVKKDAINKIIHLAPQWTRGDCWRRIRQLRKTQGLGHVAKHRRRDGGSRSSTADRRPPGPWTSADDDKLLNLAGYEPVIKIAQRLGRSVQAVRYRLGALGMSARVTDGWSLRALRKLLRAGPSRLRYLVGHGILRVRDPRVTSGSLAAHCEKNSAFLEAAALERTAAVLASSEDAFSWERTADLLGLNLAQIQELIFSGQLKLVDWFVTDRSFEDFCKKHGTEINLALLDPATAKWLRNEYGVEDVALNTADISRAQKHALIIRTCVCGRQIAGNPYFRHIRKCRMASGATSATRSNMPDSSNRVLVIDQPLKSTKASASLRQAAKGG